MTHIIFIEDLNSEADLQRLKNELDQTRLDYSISMVTKSVSVKGSNDLVYVAKQAIAQAGYTIL